MLLFRSYVVDSGNHRIQKFDGNGTFLCSFGNRGKTEGQLNFPSGIAVDKEGAVIVVDSGNNRVVKYVPTEEEINRGKEQSAPSPAAGTVQPPRTVAVKPGDTEIYLSWMDVPGAVSYNLYFNTAQGITTQSGTNFKVRTSSLNLDAPQMQWTDAAARALGQQYSNVSLGGRVSGPLKYNAAFYNLSFQGGRRSNEIGRAHV